MMYQDRGFAPRQMVDVSAMNIKCAQCGSDIRELPFNPDPARLNTILCRDCMRAKRNDRFGGSGGGRGRY